MRSLIALSLLLVACDATIDDDQTEIPVDADGDGYDHDEDCDDTNADVHPDADELCNGEDDDCDGETDEGATDAETFFFDEDGDGFGDAAQAEELCEAEDGWVEDGSDCNDGDAAVYPGATDLCDDVDSDCDGDYADGEDAGSWYADGDGDGFGAGDVVTACEPEDGWVGSASDCDDTNPAVNPDAEEICNGIDDDCSGGADDIDLDGTGWSDCDEFAVSVHAAGDDEVEVYVDGVLVGSTYGWSDTLTWTGIWRGGDHVVALYGVDNARVAAASLAAIEVDGVTVAATGDGSWLHATGVSSTDAWTDVGYDDSGWGTPAVCSYDRWSHADVNAIEALGAQWVSYTAACNGWDPRFMRWTGAL